MFAASLIVFRETLEAALFVGIIAAATKQLPQRGRWLAGGVAAGVAGALLLALSAEQVGTWADGIGQDLVNIGILTVALSMLVWHCVWVSTHGRQMAMEARQLGASVQGGQRKPWVEHSDAIRYRSSSRAIEYSARARKSAVSRHRAERIQNK